jgi:hypothetical protein
LTAKDGLRFSGGRLGVVRRTLVMPRRYLDDLASAAMFAEVDLDAARRPLYD